MERPKYRFYDHEEEDGKLVTYEFHFLSRRNVPIYQGPMPETYSMQTEEELIELNATPFFKGCLTITNVKKKIMYTGENTIEKEAKFILENFKKIQLDIPKFRKYMIPVIKNSLKLENILIIHSKERICQDQNQEKQ